MIKKAEIFLVFCLLVSIVLKLLHLEGSGILLGLSVTFLAMLYYPFGLFFFNSIPLKSIFQRTAYQHVSLMRGIGSFGAGVVLATLLIGIMFRVLMLEGSGVMLLMGMTSAPFVLIVLITKFFANTTNPFYKSMLIRTLVIVATGALIFLPSFLQSLE